MNPKFRYLEVFVLGVVAGGLLVTTSFNLHIHLLNFVYRSGIWDLREGIIRIVFLVYALLLAGLTLASVFLVRNCGTTLVEQSLGFGRSLTCEVRSFVPFLSSALALKKSECLLAAVIAVGLTLRGYFLAQPMRYDEAYTFLNFINKDFPYTFYYPLPNNHVFHTLMVRASVALLGGHPVAIRLPAFLAGALVILTSFTFTRLLCKLRSGFFTSALVAVFPYLVLYDTMARGYSLLVLLSLWLAIVGLRFSSSPNLSLCFLMSLITSLGLFTIPSFLFPSAGVVVWVSILTLIRGFELRTVVVRFLFPFCAMTTALTSLFYTPVVVATNGVGTIIGNRFIAGMPWKIFLGQLPLSIVSTFINIGQSVPPTLILGLLIFLIVGIFFSVRKKNWAVVALLPALLLGCSIPLFIQHHIPYARTWIFFLPFFFVLMDAGYVELSNLVPTFYRWHIHGAVLIGIILWAFILMNGNVITSSSETGTFPEASAVVKVLSEEMALNDKLLVGCPADAPVLFYMWYEGVPSRKRATPFTHQKEFYVVKKSEYSLSDLTSANVRKLAVLGDAEIYVRELPNWESHS
jgi:hypothetical protein